MTANATGPPRLVLFGSPGSRSPLVNWYMHELDLAFEERPPHDSANPHPFGQIPALVDRDEAAPFGRVFESGAILAYLGDAFDPNLRASPARRADALKWIVWANASLDPCLFIEDARGRVLDSGARAKEPPRTLLRLEAWLAGGGGGGGEGEGEGPEREWLAGEGERGVFGPADVAVGAYLLFVPQFFGDVSFARFPRIAAYMARCAARPAYARAFGRETADALTRRCEEWATR